MAGKISNAMLTDHRLDALAAAIDRRHAGPWPHPAGGADTTASLSGRLAEMATGLRGQIGVYRI